MHTSSEYKVCQNPSKSQEKDLNYHVWLKTSSEVPLLLWWMMMHCCYWYFSKLQDLIPVLQAEDLRNFCSGSQSMISNQGLCCFQQCQDMLYLSGTFLLHHRLFSFWTKKEDNVRLEEQKSMPSVWIIPIHCIQLVNYLTLVNCLQSWNHQNEQIKKLV